MTSASLVAPSWKPLDRALPGRLFRAREPLPYLGTAWLLTFLPALALAALVGAVAGESAQPDFPLGSWAVFLLVVIFAPVVETLIMGSVLLVLRSFLPPVAAVALSSAGWGVAHSVQAPAWGLVIWWPFLIFSTAFLVWRERNLLLAFVMVSAMHALHNVVPALALVLKS